MAQTENSSRDPDAARAQLEATRARMSSTIDEIEATLLQKKEEIRSRLDIKARIREKPLHAAGLVVGIGFLIGFLTGGDDDLPAEITDRRSALWESRARRLLRIAREQEGEIERLESSLAAIDLDEDDEYEVWEEDEPWDEDDIEAGYGARLAILGESVADRLTSTFGELSRAVIEGVRAKL